MHGRAARRCWEGESEPLILEMPFQPAVNETFAFQKPFEEGLTGRNGYILNRRRLYKKHHENLKSGSTRSENETSQFQIVTEQVT